MQNRFIIAAVALALFTGSAGVAVAQGTWQGGPGQLEPSTEYDTSEYMWSGPNTDAVDKIYFNGWLSMIHGLGIATEPEFDGGSTQTLFTYHGNAVLGYWRDCNGDGYIGNKMTPSNYGNWASYPVSVYGDDVDTDTCPDGTYYNDGAWIEEFLPISPEGEAGRPYEEDRECEPQDDFLNTTSACYGAVIDQFYLRANPDVVEDDGIRVWFDGGVPDGVAGEVRDLTERGWLQDSDGTLRWVDFTLGRSIESVSEEGVTVVNPVTGEEVYRVPATHVWRDKPNIGGCDHDANGDRVFGSGDTNTCGLYPLYQVKRLVNDSDHEDDRATPLVRTWQEGSGCDDEGIPVGDTTIYHKRIEPGVHPSPLTEGSVGGTIVHFREGFNNYDETSGECENEYGFTNLEGGETKTGKTFADSAMFYVQDRRTRALEPANHDDASLDIFGTGKGGFWMSDYTFWQVPPTMGTYTISRPTATFYAGLTDASLSNPLVTASAKASIPGGALLAGEYGEEQCGDNYNSGETSAGGWYCDQQTWEEQLVDDGLSRDRYPIIGDPFTLRDVDCYDGTLFREEVAGEEVAPRASALAVFDVTDQVLQGTDMAVTCDPPLVPDDDAE